MTQGTFGTVAEHFSDPLHRGRMDHPDFVGRAGSSGNMGVVVIYLRTSNGVVLEGMHDSQGCGYTVACGSILTEWIRGRRIEECLALTGGEFRRGIEGIPPHKLHCPELVVAAMHDALRASL